MSIDLVGTRFKRLLVINRGNGKLTPYWLCRCDCGQEENIRESKLTSGRRSSCGCARGERKKSPEYHSWRGVISRCTYPKDIGWKNYGGRGITVCARWLHSFDAFLADMGPKPSPKHTIDRKDTNGHYAPDNCRWATKQEQLRNTRSNVMITFQDRTQCLMAWADELGFRHDTLWHRLYTRKWTAEKAFTTPALTKSECGKIGGAFKRLLVAEMTL